MHSVHLVRVTTDRGSEELWAAATPREEAVTLVSKAIPDGWRARLMHDSLRPRAEVMRTMAPGEVRKLVK